MTRPFDDTFSTWLEEGPVRAPDRIVETLRSNVAVTSQRKPSIFRSRSDSAMSTSFKLGGLAATGVAVLLVALMLRPAEPPIGGQPTPSAIPTEAPTPTAAPTAGGPQELRAGPFRLDGEYRANAFAVPFEFTAGDAGWHAQWVTPHLVNLGLRSMGSELQFFAVYEVVGDDGSPMPVPDSFIDWLQAKPGLKIVSSEPIEIGGVEGVNLALRATGDSEVLLLPPPDPDAPNPQPYGIGINPDDEPRDETPIRHYVFEDVLGGGPLLITYYTEDAAFFDAIDPLLESVEFIAPEG